MIFDLLQDLLLATKAIPSKASAATRLTQVLDCIRKNPAFLTTHPTAMAQSLENHLRARSRGLERPWLRSLAGSFDSERFITFASPQSDDGITACCLSSIHCFAGHRSGLIRVWRLQDGKEEAEWKINADGGLICSLFADSTGELLVVDALPENLELGQRAHRITVVETPSGECVSSFEVFDSVESVHLSPDQRLLATIEGHGGVTIRNLDGVEISRHLKNTNIVVCEWLDQDYLYLATEDEQLIRCESSSGKILYAVPIIAPKRSPLMEARLCLYGVSLVRSPHERWIAVGVAGGFTRIFDADSGIAVAELDPFHDQAALELQDARICANCLCFSADNRYLFEGRSRRIYAWDTSTWTLVAQWQSQVGLVGRFVVFDNSLFAVTDIRETAMRFLPTNQIVVEELPREFPLNKADAGVFTVPGSILGVAISLSGRFVAVAWGPTYQFVGIRLLDLKSRRTCREIARATWPAILTDEKIIFSTDSPLTVAVESIQDGDALAEWRLKGEFLDKMTVSVSGTFLICLSFESRPKPKSPPKPITVHDEKTGRTFQMPGIEMPPRTPFEARHGQFETTAYARIVRMQDFSLTWEGIVGSCRAHRANLDETKGTLEIEWQSGDERWTTTQTLPSEVLKHDRDTATPQEPRYSLEAQGPFTAVWDQFAKQHAAWWPAPLSMVASSPDGLTWVGAAEGSSFVESFQIEVSDPFIEERR